MSQQLLVFVWHGRIPDGPAWQKGIDRLGLGVRLPVTFDPASWQGFVSCSLGSRPSGFELSREPAADYLRCGSGRASLVGDRDTALAVSWGTGQGKWICAYAACAALVRFHNAIVLSPETDAPVTAEQLIDWARGGVESGSYD